MMDKQKRESSPLSSPGGRINVFKIPKKKADDWCEEVQATSPLTRLGKTDIRNVTVRKRPYSSSYESFNEPRNKATHAYFASPSSCWSMRTEHIRKEVEKEVDVKSLEKRLREQKEPTRESALNTVCRDVSNTPISPQKDSSIGVKKSCSEEESSNVSKASDLECKNSVKNNAVSSPNTREKTYCCKRAEHQSKKSPTPPKDLSVHSSVDQSPSPSSESVAESPPKSSNTIIDRAARTCTESNKSSLDSSVAIPPMNSSHSYTSRLTRRKTPLRIVGKRNLPLEPIVLSSDEEEREHEESVKLGNEQTLSESLHEMNEDEALEMASLSPRNDVEPMDCSATKVDSLPEVEYSILQLTFLNVYYGKKKGSADGSATVTPKSIEIPLKVPLEQSKYISLDTMKLQKYGLWLTSTVRSSAIIILWITTDYIPLIEKQIGATSKTQASKSNELLFLELVEPLTCEQQSLLGKIMKEASERGLPTLADALTWEEMYSMLEDLSKEDCSFIANCGMESKKEQESSNTSPLKDPPETPEKCKDGRYSVSMVPRQGDTLKEVDKGGTLLRLLVYPPPPTKGGLAITNEDLECLEHGEFLNDVIIDFYLKYLLLEKFPTHFAQKCHVFSSFFFRCLTRKDNVTDDKHLEMPAAQRRHRRVKTWTRHVDIFAKDFIFVPVNENSHWYLVVICFPYLEKNIYEDRKDPSAFQDEEKRGDSGSGSVIIFNDRLSKKEETIGEGSNSESEGSTSSGSSCNPKHIKHKDKHLNKLCKRPCLLIFDSLKTGSVQTTVQVLREYLKAEWDVKRKSPREFSRSSMRDLYPKVPKQNNSTDCGLYVLQYVESFAQKPIESFEPPMHLENWFPASVVKNKRDKIRDLILQLHVQQSKKR
ncbi:sentrin-specific protease 7 isoform 2-T2 [Anomaloglossus baeobatrachus]|uniref:sentrin-specific protease 7 isoform X2 n=1 Tax=Anomaloglossus baeobatrachus TaxID=238106 RepID=UPI003F50666E